MQKAPEVTEILKDRRMMVADRDPVHGAFLMRLARQIGFDPDKITRVSEPTEALRLVRDEGVTTILFDDSLGYGALNSLQEALAAFPAESVCIFLVSDNSSQAGVARAVEAEVDGFCFKPFSGEELEAEFIATFTEKALPDEFRKVLNLGRSRLYAGDLEQAEKLFEKAKDIGATPSSAHFYAGQVKLMRQLLEESRKEFMQGVLLNQVHCKCLKAMFELLYSQDKTAESYEVLRRLVGVFPENSERLNLAIKLAVKTGNYFDIDTWFEVYEGQMDKTEEARKHVCSALSIFGRFLLMTRKPEQALKAFERALTIADRKEVFLTYAVESLQKFGLGEEAVRLLTTHDPEFAAVLADPKNSAA